MFNGTLNNLLANSGDDVARGIAKTAAKTANKAERNLVEKASQYLNNADTLMDKYGLAYTTDNVPVASLQRRPEFQPRTTASGAGTERSVYENGYQEGLVDQPLLVRKNGDVYEVLGGHSRTSGMERRAKDGLPNPEFVKARIYENITDDQAKRVSRAANQGGQYESTLDMAKSINESMAEGVTPSVQKQNMTKGYGYDDYDYLWKTVQGDRVFKDKLFLGALSQDDVLSVARHGRQRGITPEQTLGIITSMEKNGTFTKRNAHNVMNLLAGKTKAGLMKDAQTGLFGDIETAVNSVELLNDINKTSAELKRTMNAFSTVSDEGNWSDEFNKELQKRQDELQKKMNHITDEILNRYKAKNAAKPKIEFDTSQPDIAQGQGSMFETTPQEPINTTKVSKSTGATKSTQIPQLTNSQPKKINVLKINDNSIGSSVPVNVKKYLPELPTESPQATNNQSTTNSQPNIQRSPRRERLKLQAINQILPEPKDIANMSDKQFANALVSWKQALANIMSIQGATNERIG